MRSLSHHSVLQSKSLMVELKRGYILATQALFWFYSGVCTEQCAKNIPPTDHEQLQDKRTNWRSLSPFSKQESAAIMLVSAIRTMRQDDSMLREIRLQIKGWLLLIYTHLQSIGLGLVRCHALQTAS